MAIVYYLLKFCKERAHAEDFIAGRLYLRKLRYFQELEEGDDGRGDRLEGLSHIWQPNSGMVMQFNDIRIPATEMAAPAFLTSDATLDNHVLCLYAASSGPFESLSAENLEAFREYMRIPEICSSMGGEHTVLVHNFAEFQNRVLAAAKRDGFKVTGGPVSYYDDGIYSGATNPGFWKSRRFDWQRERRYMVDARGRLNDPGFWNIGNIADIATIVDFAALNQNIKWDLPE